MAKNKRGSKAHIRRLQQDQVKGNVLRSNLKRFADRQGRFKQP